MLVKSYSELYLDDVSRNIGTIFEYAIDYGYDPIVFWDIYICSEVVKEIENGNPRFLVGLSGVELFNKIIQNEEFYIPKPFIDLSSYYWAGWALAIYQNYKGISFYEINKVLPIKKVLNWYKTLHEADISKFIMLADEMFEKQKTETNLKRIRIAAGLSQSQLATKSLVSIRNIQMYEQRQNNINKAQGDILLRLSKTLGCKIEDLFETNSL